MAPARAARRGVTRAGPRLLGRLLHGLPDLPGHPGLVLGRVLRLGRGQVPAKREHDADGHRADRSHQPGPAAIGDPVDLSWARRFGLWAAYAFGQPLPPAWPGVGRNAFAHESGIHADGALKDRANYELYDDEELGPFPADWFTRPGRVVLTGEYGGKAGFRHVLDGLGLELADGTEDLAFSLVQLCASATGKPLTDDELRLIAGYPRQLALLFPGQLSPAG